MAFIIEEPIFAGFDHVQEREQEVKAHTGSVTFTDLKSPILLAQDLRGGCGGMVWECANIMIDYIIWKNQQMKGNLFQQQKLVEIGSGTGLVGLAVAKICPEISELIMTDQLPMMDLMQENIKLNQLSHIVKADVLNWGEAIPIESHVLNADIILASDCIYLEVAFIPLLETMLALGNKDTSVIYLAYRKRRNADKRFFQMARKKFIFEDVMEDPKRVEYTRRGFRLFCIKRKPVVVVTHKKTKA